MRGFEPRDGSDVDLNEHFRKHYGLITASRAAEFGLSARQMALRVDRGEWQRVRAGVFRHGAATPSWRGHVLAEVLGRRAVASHRAAAALWELEVFRQPPVEITAPNALKVDPQIRVHVSTQWARRNEVDRFGIPCTGVERTILDCGAVSGLGRLERLAEAAIRKNLTSWASLRNALIDDSRRGRDGCGSLRVLLDRRDGSGVVPLSDFSRRVVLLLVNAGLPEPVVEYPIRNANGRHLLQVDLAWPALRKAWELDGLQWHFGRADVERDRRKRNAVVAEGWVLQEVLWSMYQREPRALIEMARRFLASTAPNSR